MPLLNALEFAKNKLVVTYRGSLTPQELTLSFKLKKATSTPGAPMRMQSIVFYVTLGMAGSDVFDPSAGSAELLRGPTRGKEAMGPDYTYQFRVAGVAPVFLRLLVEDLRGVGFDVPLASMDISGELSPDGSVLAATDNTVRAWLEDKTAYPKQWPSLGFPVKIDDPGLPGFTARVMFARPLDKAVQEDLQGRFLTWKGLTSNYVSPSGEMVRAKLGQTMPKFAVTKREMTAHFELYENASQPAAALLLNMLQRVHETLLPIAEVELKI